MATIKTTSTAGGGFDDYKLPDPGTATKGTQSGTKWHLGYAGGALDEAVGKGFTFAASDLSGGTVSGFTFTESKTEKFQVTGLTGVPAADLGGAADGKAFLATALSGKDIITGGNGDDHLLGFAGSDQIDG